ncbi:MAG: alpha-amylase family glycosyl hydrolase, partial [Bacteroidales bacterium]
MKYIIIIISISLAFYSCQKDKNDDNIKPPPPGDTTFTVPKTEDIVMYEVNLRALSASGDFQGVIGRMDEIKALGINVIWLMPIHPIGEINSVNSPYSVKNYKQVNPEFGTLSDFKALVKKAHDLEMAVIIDWVANHTAWDNPWIANSDWY